MQAHFPKQWLDIKPKVLSSLKRLLTTGVVQGRGGGSEWCWGHLRGDIQCMCTYIKSGITHYSLNQSGKTVAKLV